ncbi:hypothetical protein [Mycobacterium sp. MS1601]|uniref:hypothetical protein n=1 Tax=Mycobacterium sp. MS1601 TaxID=1936029 RepID=UPI0012FA18B9|nr:hypothetical protein [Mycobacterium sp. MS1601]
MSTIATRLNSVTTKVKVGTAAVALVGAATLTPAIAEATPSPMYAPVAQTIGSVVDLSSVPLVVGGGLNAGVDFDGAIADFNPFEFIFTNIVQPIAGWFYSASEFFVGLASQALNEFAKIFRVGPYGTSTSSVG